MTVTFEDAWLRQFPEPDDLARMLPTIDLEFDSEAGAVGIYAGSEADIRAVAELIAGLAGTHEHE